MTVEETKVLLGIMKTAYPNFYKNITREEAEQIVDLWSQMFADDNPKLVTESVKSLICSLKFPPTIADVKNKMQLITKPIELTEMEAWTKIKNAMSIYSAAEKFQELSEILQKLVGSPGQLREWAMMDAEHVETVVKSNFMRSYTARVKADKQYDSLPSSTKELMNGYVQKLLNKGDEECRQERHLRVLK